MWGTILGNDYYKNGTCNLRRKKKKKEEEEEEEHSIVR